MRRPWLELHGEGGVVDLTKSKRLSGKEALVLLLYLPGHSKDRGEPITGRTRLIKTMFLFSKEIQPHLRKQGLDFALPEFAAYGYGPFSADVLNDLETLHTLDMLSIETIPTFEPLDVLADLNGQEYYHRTAGEVDRQSMERYRITEDCGRGFCETMLLPHFRPAQLDFVKQFKMRCNDVCLTTLLRYVYTRYPKYTENAEIRDRVLKYDTLLHSSSAVRDS